MVVGRLPATSWPTDGAGYRKLANSNSGNAQKKQQWRVLYYCCETQSTHELGQTLTVDSRLADPLMGFSKNTGFSCKRFETNTYTVYRHPTLAYTLTRKVALSFLGQDMNADFAQAADALTAQGRKFELVAVFGRFMASPAILIDK